MLGKKPEIRKKRFNSDEEHVIVVWEKKSLYGRGGARKKGVLADLGSEECPLGFRRNRCARRKTSIRRSVEPKEMEKTTYAIRRSGRAIQENLRKLLSSGGKI